MWADVRYRIALNKVVFITFAAVGARKSALGSPAEGQDGFEASAIKKRPKPSRELERES
jgi:hypothetical protein